MTFNKDYPQCIHCGKKFQTTKEGIEAMFDKVRDYIDKKRGRIDLK